MHLSTDAHFEKGITHAICQDYACAGRCSETVTAAVVCDGCSRATDSDSGARILAHAFLQEAPAGPSGFRNRVAARLTRGLRQLGLPDEAGQATAVGWTLDTASGLAHGYVWGDGYLAVRRNEALEAWLVRHPHNAPPYLGYWTAPNWLQVYREDPSYGLTLKIEHHSPAGACAHTTSEGGWEMILPLDHLPVTLIAGTDGVASFWGGGALLPAMDVVREFTAFRDSDAAFVLRRMRRQLHLWSRRDTPLRPTDDVATAAIAVRPDPVAP